MDYADKSTKRGYFIIFSLAVFLVAFGIVIAVVPNPGHKFTELETCSNNGQILKMVNGVWACADDQVGSGGQAGAVGQKREQL